MNYAITVGDILTVLGAIVGLAVLAFGFLMVFAAGMSSNPSASDEVGGKGCWTLFAGLVIIIAAAFAAFS